MQHDRARTKGRNGWKSMSSSGCGLRFRRRRRLGLVALIAHLRNRAAHDLDLDIVGDLDLKLAILDLDHLADDAAGGNDSVAAANPRHHVAMLLEPLLLRP